MRTVDGRVRYIYGALVMHYLVVKGLFFACFEVGVGWMGTVLDRLV